MLIKVDFFFNECLTFTFEYLKINGLIKFTANDQRCEHRWQFNVEKTKKSKFVFTFYIKKFYKNEKFNIFINCLFLRTLFRLSLNWKKKYANDVNVKMTNCHSLTKFVNVDHRWFYAFFLIFCIAIEIRGIKYLFIINYNKLLYCTNL